MAGGGREGDGGERDERPDASPLRQQAGSVPRAMAAFASWIGAPVLVAVLPVLAVLVHAITQIHRAPLQGGDYALLEMGARSALHGVQRLGPYSRFGWDHPGPATFYWSAPFYAISDQRPEGIAVAAIVGNLLALAAVVATVRRAAGVAAGWTASAVVLAALAAGGTVWLDRPWNPLTAILPVAALAALGAGAVAGLRWALPLAVAAASFAMQTHVGTAPVVALIILALLPLAVWRWRQDAGPWRVPVLAALAVLAVMWSLPVLQQLTGHPGNLGELVRFFTRRRQPGHSLSEAIKVAGPQLTMTRGHLFGSLTKPPETQALSVRVGAKVLLLLVAALVCLAVNVRRGRWFGAALCSAGVAGAVGAVLAAERVTGPLIGYLTSAALAVGLVLWTAVAITIVGELTPVARRVPDRLRLVLGGVIVVALLCAGGSIAARGATGNLFAETPSDPHAVQLLAKVDALSRAGPHRRVFIDPQARTRTWSLAALLVNRLERDGVTVRTPPVWQFMFGAQRTGSVGDAPHIRLVDVRVGRPPATGRLLGQVDFTRAYLLRSP